MAGSDEVVELLGEQERRGAAPALQTRRGWGNAILGGFIDSSLMHQLR